MKPSFILFCLFISISIFLFLKGDQLNLQLSSYLHSHCIPTRNGGYFNYVDEIQLSYKSDENGSVSYCLSEGNCGFPAHGIANKPAFPAALKEQSFKEILEKIYEKNYHYKNVCRIPRFKFIDRTEFKKNESDVRAIKFDIRVSMIEIGDNIGYIVERQAKRGKFFSNERAFGSNFILVPPDVTSDQLYIWFSYEMLREDWVSD